MNTISMTVMPAGTAVRMVRRGAVYWLLLRLVMLMITQGKLGRLTPPAGGMIAAAIVAGILAYSEFGFFRERTLAANLGIWYGWYALMPAAVSLAIDILLWTFIPALRMMTPVQL